MKVFVIHRFKERRSARAKLKRLRKGLSMSFDATFLDSSGGLWKRQAEKAIDQAEVVIVFNRGSCKESENAKWEIEKAIEAKKEIVELDEGVEDKVAISRLKSIYDLKGEFDQCFSTDTKDILDQYKLMIEGSEHLIERRQKTSAFFVTAIGSLLAIAGLLVKSGAIKVESIGILYGFSIVGLLLCNSWRNLIDNYGKLNKAKFDVILRLEESLSAQMYSAEWIALGKGMRPKKYRSFTSTENNVPMCFAVLILLLTLCAVAWQIWGQ
jgi:hypothetical protein